MTLLNRALTTPLLTFYGVGMILGAGIYSVIGKAAGMAGDSLWISFLLAALVALLTAFSYAELATTYPRTGAEYVYLKEGFPKIKWLASVIGLMMAFAGAATATTVALAFGGYLRVFFDNPEVISALILLIVFAGINLLGIKESSWVNVVFTLIEITGLGIIVYLEVQSPTFGNALTTNLNPRTFMAASLVIFAYFGFENIVNLVEEAKNPERSLPWAIFLSIAITTILYL